jgi:hypothetical protein
MIDYTRWITVYLSLWFSCPRFSRVYHDACDTYCQNGTYCQNAWLLLDCSRFMAWIHLLPKWRPTRAHKKSRTQFWLSDSSGIIYHLWWLWENILIKNKHETFNCCVYCTALNFSSLLQVAPFHYKISEILLAVFNHQRSSIAEARNTEAGFTL